VSCKNICIQTYQREWFDEYPNNSIGANIIRIGLAHLASRKYVPIMFVCVRFVIKNVNAKAKVMVKLPVALTLVASIRRYLKTNKKKIVNK
jgi:hypothetical protein